jgi:hypothetical protein
MLGYGIVFKPVLSSRHTEGKAVDMDVAWQNDMAVAKGDGSQQTISSAPYGVVKLVSDPRHWFSDGH